MDTHAEYLRKIGEWYRLERVGMKPGLAGISALLSRCGNPHTRFDSIHIAGTNGKGSASAVAHSVLREAGFRVGLFTSPHLVDFRERIRVDGKPISVEGAVSLLGELDTTIRKNGSSFFEATTAMAFLHFARSSVTAAVLETGLGGRLDSTNVVESKVSVVTSIGKDHCELLGDTLERIAKEKLGIVKRGSTLISGITQKELQKIAHAVTVRQRSEMLQLGKEIRVSVKKVDSHGSVFDLRLNGRVLRNLELPLLGVHQVRNAACAVAAADRFCAGALTQEALREGLRRTRWPGRAQYVEGAPPFLLDVAHNPPGARVLKKLLVQLFPGRKVVAVVGMMQDKDYPEFVRILEGAVEAFVFTSLRNPRAALPETLAECAAKKGLVAGSLPEALERATRLSHRHGLVLVSGSCVTVGEAIEALGIGACDEI